MAKIATRKFNPYEQAVRKKQAEIQKQSNALALQRINEGNDANLAALQTRTDLANQGWANAELAHRTGVSSLTDNTQGQAQTMGNARGSWAGDYIAKSPERVALEQNLGYAKQAKGNELKQIDADRASAAQEYARQLADYELERKRQAAEEWAATHYNYTAPKPQLEKPKFDFLNPDGTLRTSDLEYALAMHAISEGNYKQALASRQDAYNKYQDDYKYWLTHS